MTTIDRGGTGGLAAPILLAASTVLAASWGVRSWVGRSLEPGERVPLVGDLFRLTLGENAGVAFGLLRGSPHVVPWLSALALAAVVVYLARPLRGSPAGGAALGLVLGGGLANLLDRLGDGSVTDYFDLGIGAWRWPTFNLPDVAVTAGLVLAALLLVRDAEPAPHSERGREWT